MMIAYGAYARATSARSSGFATRYANSGVGSSEAPPAMTAGAWTGTGWLWNWVCL